MFYSDSHAELNWADVWEGGDGSEEWGNLRTEIEREASKGRREEKEKGSKSKNDRPW